jgi:hypothetical protein
MYGPEPGLAKDFAAKVPEHNFSPAEVLSFLLERKNSPIDAVNGKVFSKTRVSLVASNTRSTNNKLIHALLIRLGGKSRGSDPTEKRVFLGTRERMLNMRRSERTEWREGQGAIC